MCQIIKFKHSLVYQNKQHTTTIMGPKSATVPPCFDSSGNPIPPRVMKIGSKWWPFHGFTGWKANLSIPSPGAAPFWMCQHFSKSGWQPHQFHRSFRLYCATSVMTYITPSVVSGAGSPLASWTKSTCGAGCLGTLGLTRFKAFPTRSMMNDPFKNAQNYAHSNTRATQEFDTKLLDLTCKKHVFYIF